MELFKADKSIKIAVAWFTNEMLLAPLVLKLKMGVSVEIILNDDEINRNGKTSLDFTDFLKAGGVLRWNKTNKLMHEKFCIIDNHIVIFGTYNWTNKAEYSEESITIAFDEKETTNFYLEKFNRMTNIYDKEDWKKSNSVETIPVEVVGREMFFDDSKPFFDDIFFEILSQNGKKGLRQIDGEIILDIFYQDIYKVGNFFCVKRFMEDSQLFDPIRRSFVGPTFDSIERKGAFSDYLFKKNGKMGCLAYDGSCRIKCVYDKIEHIAHSGWSPISHYKYSYLVEKEGEYGIYTGEGNNIIPCIYENISPLLHGGGYPPIFYIVKRGKKALFDANSGKQLTDFLFDSFTVHFYESINISAEKNKKYALMSYEGEFLTDFIYDSIQGLCTLEFDNANGEVLFYDRHGDVVGSTGAFYYVKCKNHWGIINSKGVIEIDSIYNSIEELKECRKYSELLENDNYEIHFCKNTI